MSESTNDIPSVPTGTASTSSAATTTVPAPPVPLSDPWWLQRKVADLIIYLDRIRRWIARKLGINPVAQPPSIGPEVMLLAGLSDVNMNVWKPIRVPPFKADNAMDAAGAYGTVVAFMQPRRELIEKSIPPELTTQPPPGSLLSGPLADTHPLALTFGQQASVRAFSNPLNMGLDYLESVIIIPRLYLRKEAVMRQFGPTMAADKGTYFGPFNYLPRLYLDQLLPTIMGWVLAYNKHWGRIEYSENTLQASSLFAGSPHYKAQFTRGALRPNPAADYPVLVPWLKMLNAPIVSRTLTGKLLFTKFYWPWHFASLWDVNLQLDVTNSGVAALPPGQYSMQTISTVQTSEALSTNFAFVTALGWRLLLPFARDILKSSDGEGLFPLVQ